MFKRFKVTGINENPKKPKCNLMKYLALGCVMALPAFALLKTGVLSMNKNVLVADKNKYDIVADLDGGKFEMGTTPEFTKMDNGNWLYKYKPVPTSIKLPVPVKDGYEFTGWSVSAKPDIQKEYSIPAWHKGNLNVKANWKILDANLMTGLEFNSKVKAIEGFGGVTEIRFEKGETSLDGIGLANGSDQNIIKGYINGNVLHISSQSDIKANSDCSGMFAGFSNVASINFNNFSALKTTDMHNMFNGCKNLTTIDVSKWNTSQVTDMYQMFYECSSLKTVDVSKWDTSQVIDMHNMFGVCSSLIYINVANWNTSKVINIRGMFNDCLELTTIDVSKWNTSQVTDMHNIFNGCIRLETVDVSKWNTSQVTDMRGIFNNCSNLSVIDVSDWDTSKVIDMDNLFNKCSSLITVDVSKWNTSQVTDMHNMFSGCTKLETLNISNFSLEFVESMRNFLADCSALAGELTVRYATNTNVEGMFSGCSSNADAKFIVKYTSPETKEVARKMVATKRLEFDHVYLYEDQSVLLDGLSLNNKLKSISGYTRIEFIKAEPKHGIDVSAAQDKSISAYVEDNILKIACIGDIYTGSDVSNMFKGLTAVTNIEFTNFNSSNATNMSYMFSACNSLVEIDLSKLNTSSVTTMHDMFAGCRSIKNFDVSMLDTRNVTSLHGTFYDCDGLINLDLNSLDTSKVTDIGFIIAECDNLQSINMDKLDVSKVTSIRHLFKYCRSLENVVLPQFDFTKVRDTEQAFAECDKLSSSITINGGATTAYKEMFYNCSSNTNAKFVVSYTTGNKSLAQNMVNTKVAGNHVYLNEPVKVKYIFKSSDGSTLPAEVLSLLPEDTNIYGIYMNDIVTVKNPSKTSITVSNNKYTFSGYDKDVNFKILSNMIKGDSDKYVDIVGTWKKEATIPVIQGETLIPGPEFNSELGIGQDSIYHIEFRKVSSMSGISGIDVSAKHNNSIIAYKPNSTTYYIVSTKKILANKDASNMFNTTYKTLQTLDLTNFDIGQSENIESMFDGQETLTEIKNIENMHTYHVKNMDTTFYYCSSLRRLDLSKWNTANVTSMRGTFGACGASTINVANWNTSSCTNMRSTFMNMENLTSLDLSGWDTSKAKDISSFISRSTNLSTVTGNIKLGVINDAMWLIKEMPNIRCTITATDSYNSSSFSSSYSGMIRNSTNGSGRVNVNYTSNARTLANEIVSDSRSGSSPNVYLGSQISSVSMRNIGDKLPVTKRVDHVVSSKDNIRALNDYELNRKVGEKSFMKVSLNNTPTTYAAAHQNMKPAAITRKINITLNNGSMSMYPVQKIQIPSGKIGDLAKPDLNPKYAGQFGGYFYDKNCTIPVKPNDVVTQDIELYAKW